MITLVSEQRTGDPVGARCFEAVSRSLDRIAEHHPWGSIGLGKPDEAHGPWLTLDDLTEPACADRLIARLSRAYEYETPQRILDNYLFRYALDVPLLLAGYLFIAERRVPALVDNVVLRDYEWLQHGRLVEPLLFVLPDDPLAGEPGVKVIPDLDALTDTLFAEVERALAPLLAAFRARRFVAPANGWGSMLDALAQGMTIAGEAGLGMDEAWARWQQAVRGRTFPVRRRPLRFTYLADGERREMAIRAGCCLWFKAPASLYAEQRYCAACYLTDDVERVRIMTNVWRERAKRGGVETDHGDS